jgi:hypothetical protein
MILVYQMSKVASRSWLEAVRTAAARDGAEPVHVHFVAEPNIAKVAAIAAMPPQSQTIANQFLLRDMLRKGAVARTAIDRARQAGETIRVITGMRDPVARSLSLVHFFADFYGDVSRPLDRIRGGDGAATAEAVTKWWQAVLAGAAPEDSFARLMTFLIGSYRAWFAEELGAILGVTLGERPFVSDRGAQRVSGEGVEVLLYRVEDLDPQAPAHGALLAAASDFLGTPVAGLPQVNTAASRRSSGRYDAARQSLRLSASTLDAIYSAPVVTHFYAAEDIASFKRRWRDGAG